MLRLNNRGWYCERTKVNTIFCNFLFQTRILFSFSWLYQTGRWICFLTGNRSGYSHIIPTICLTQNVCHIYWSIIWPLWLWPFVIGCCVGSSNYTKPFIPPIMRIIPCVINLTENKLSLFKSNSVKMLYVLASRLQYHANAPSDYFVFIISHTVQMWSLFSLFYSWQWCFSLFNYKLHTLTLLLIIFQRRL